MSVINYPLPCLKLFSVIEEGGGGGGGYWL